MAERLLGVSDSDDIICANDAHQTAAGAAVSIENVFADNPI